MRLTPFVGYGFNAPTSFALFGVNLHQALYTSGTIFSRYPLHRHHGGDFCRRGTPLSNLTAQDPRPATSSSSSSSSSTGCLILNQRPPPWHAVHQPGNGLGGALDIARLDVRLHLPILHMEVQFVLCQPPPPELQHELAGLPITFHVHGKAAFTDVVYTPLPPPVVRHPPLPPAAYDLSGYLLPEDLSPADLAIHRQHAASLAAPLSSSSSSSLAHPSPIPLCACLLLWNRSKFLLEWLRFHSRFHNLGKTFIIDNGSDDGLAETVHWLSAFFRIELVPYTLGPQTLEAAYVYCGLRSERECAWTAYLDVDEFVQPRHAHTPPLADFLASPRTEQVGIFGLTMTHFAPNPNNSLPLEDPLNGTIAAYTCSAFRGQRANFKAVLRTGASVPWRHHITHRFCALRNLADSFFDSDYRLVHFRFQAWETERLRYLRRAGTFNAGYAFGDSARFGRHTSLAQLATPSPAYLTGVLPLCSSHALLDTCLQHFVWCSSTCRQCNPAAMFPTSRNAEARICHPDTAPSPTSAGRHPPDVELLDLLLTGAGSLGRRPPQPSPLFAWVEHMANSTRRRFLQRTSVNWHIAALPPGAAIKRRYRHIVHVLAHPLTAVAQLASYDDRLLLLLHQTTPHRQAAAVFSRWSKLARSMALWLLISEIADWTADLRLTIDASTGGLSSTVARRLCSLAGLADTPDCWMAADAAVHSSTQAGKNPAPTLSWAALDDADPALATLVRKRAAKYGFQT